MASVELQGLNSDHWETIFAQYDRNRDGKINFAEFRQIIESGDYKHDIPEHVVQQIFVASDTNGDGELDVPEFKRMLTNPRNAVILAHLRRRARQYIKFIVPQPRPRTSVVDGAYEDEYSCWPPRVAMLILSIIIMTLFAVDLIISSSSQAQGPVATDLLYDPRRRKEAWRYVTYMFVHVGVTHLVVNVIVQLMLGVPLEMVHGGLRVLLVYLAGVCAGSLGTSVCDPRVKLAGASGGVYSLMTAHVATIIMNWSELSFPYLQLFIFLVIIGGDVGTAVYNRYVLQQYEAIGYAAHFFGALAGLLVGITVLRNIEVKRAERIVRMVAMATYVGLMGAAIVWNIASPSYYPVQYV